MHSYKCINNQSIMCVAYAKFGKISNTLCDFNLYFFKDYPKLNNLFLNVFYNSSILTQLLIAHLLHLRLEAL